MKKTPRKTPLVSAGPSAALAVVPKPAGGALVTAQVVESARDFVEASLSKATRRAYKTDWDAFTRWCASNGLPSMPAAPETLVLYITTLARAGKKVATIERAKASISVAHDTATEKNPVRSTLVKRAMQGIARTIGSAPVKKTAVLGEDIAALIAATKNDRNPIRGARDAALLAVGFAGGFRRSELAAIHVEHLRFDPDGKRLGIFIPRSKTDQEGKGRWVGIAHAPTVALVRAWLAAAGIVLHVSDLEVPLFRPIHRSGCLGEKALSAEAVAEIVKKYALAVGLDPKKYAGHSLRRGFVTTAKRNGKKNEDIMRQTGHKSVETFMGYIEEAGMFDNNASEDLWREK